VRATHRIGWTVRGAVLAAALAAPAGAQPSVEAEARLTPDVVGTDEVLQLTLEVRAERAGSIHFRPRFELHNLELLGPPQRSSTFRFAAGRSFQSLQLTYLLRPLELGPAVVSDIRLELEGETFELPTQRTQVVTDPPPRRERRRGRGLPPPGTPFSGSVPDSFFRRPPEPRELKVLVRAEVQPAEPYVGQPVSYTLHIYTQTDITSIHPRELPDFQGFWAEEVKREARDTERVELDGEVFGHLVVLERRLVPRRAGVLEIPPAQLELLARVIEPRFLGTAFARPERLMRASNPLTVRVRELPPPPPGFTGAVGSLAVSATLDPPTVTVGEAALLTVTLTGGAHLPSLPPLGPGALPGLEVFPPEETATSGGKTHQRTWVYTLAPRRAGEFSLGPLEVPYFDPRVEGYRLAASEPLTLSVGPAVAAAAIAPVPHPIRSAAVPPEEHLPVRVWPWLLLTLPLGLALALRWADRRGSPHPRVRGAGDPRAALLALITAVEKGTGDRERAVHGCADRGAARQLEAAWRLYLEQRWAVPQVLLPARWAADLGERRALLPGGHALTDAVLEELAALARDLQHLRGAAQLADTETLARDIAARSHRLLRRLP
jgi:hypothetical protein